MKHGRWGRSPWLVITALLATTLAVVPGLLAAKTLRWSTRGDVQTFDPYSQNELLTNNINNLVYDRLVENRRDGTIGPRLAVSWTVVNPTTWRFNLRHDVVFHDGRPFTADDVVFSVERAQLPTSQIAQYALAVGKPAKIDDYTVEFKQQKPNPLLLEHLTTVFIMNKAWCVEHHVEKPLDFKAREETFASKNENGTGPFMLKTREPAVRTVLVRNPKWWNAFEGNVDELVYTPIGSDPTRMAALISGEIDIVTDPAPQDILRLEHDANFKVYTGLENRVLFFGMDQFRDALEGSNIKDRNPFKDRRVREAFFKTIDVDTLQAKIMRGQGVATNCFTTAPAGCTDPAFEKHPPADVEGAKKLMADAGYPNGFTLTIDCPNDRYINDADLCIATAGMLARIGVTAKVNAIPKTLYFPKLEKKETSFYMLGWGGAITDAQIVLDPMLHSPDVPSQKGMYNYGRFSDPALDKLIDAAGVEMDTAKRKDLITQALAIEMRDFRYIVLHRQKLAWVARKGIVPVLMSSNVLRVEWVTMP
jgi:peptide/nickel transport system substrate-binding protein